MVCILLHSISVEWPVSSEISSKKRSHYRVSRAVAVIARSSDSIELNVTVFYFKARQSIMPLNNIKLYPWELQRVPGSSPYAALEEARKTFLGSTT